MAAAGDAAEPGLGRLGIGGCIAAIDRRGGLDVGRDRVDDGERRADLRQLGGEVGGRELVRRAGDDVAVAAAARDRAAAIATDDPLERLSTFR